MIRVSFHSFIHNKLILIKSNSYQNEKILYFTLFEINKFCYKSSVILNNFVLQNEPRFYKEEFATNKKVSQTKTSYNFLSEHSDQIPHDIKPTKAIARQTDSNIGQKGKFDEHEVNHKYITIFPYSNHLVLVVNCIWITKKEELE